MWKVAIKDILSHKLRMLLVSSIIMFGVAFVAGVMVLTATVQKSFDDVFGDAFQNTDVVVRSGTGTDTDVGPVYPPIDASYVERISALPNVAVAEGYSQGYAQLTGKDGKTLPGAEFAGTLASSWVPDSQTTAFSLRDGRAPEAPDEVVVDAASAKAAKYSVGDMATVISAQPPQQFKIVGIAQFGNADSPGGTHWVFFTPNRAHEIFNQAGKFSEIDVNAKDGTSPEQLRDQLVAALGPEVSVITGEQAAEELGQPFKEGIGFVQYLLLVFAGIALFVGAFVINNVFAILVAQRTKQLAMLRAIGARRRQVMGSVLLEALVLGLLASLIGLGVGYLIALGLIAVINALAGDGGADISPVVSVATVVTSLVAGVVITLISSVFPAVKAARVPPLAAMRDVAVERTQISKVRFAIGVVFTIASAVLFVFGLKDNSLKFVGVASGLGFVGVALLTPLLVKPIVRILAWPIVKVRGIRGSVAKENALRSPRRTSATASALMIAVTLVSLFTVVLVSIKDSVSQQIDETFAGDLIVQGPQGGFGGLSTDLASQIDALPETGSVTPLRYAPVQLNGQTEWIAAVDPKAYAEIFSVENTSNDFASLGLNQLAIADSTAKDRNLTVGQTIEGQFLTSPKPEPFTIGAIYKGNDLSGGYFMNLATYEANVPEQFDSQIAMVAAPGVSQEQLRNAVEPLANAQPNAKVLDVGSFKDQITSQINIALGILYGLLALAVLIALIGIATTLSLSVFERTREIGLMRAVGMTRSQVRATVRWESVFMSVFGTVVGLLMGVGFALAILDALKDEGIQVVTVPVPYLVVIVIMAIIAGVGAGIWPAWRASRLNILGAIATE